MAAHSVHAIPLTHKFNPKKHNYHYRNKSQLPDMMNEEQKEKKPVINPVGFSTGHTMTFSADTDCETPHRVAPKG